MVLIDRAEYWQCAYVIRKGSFDERKAKGLEAFQDEVVRCAPFLGVAGSERAAFRLG